jgi:hypothetical protein
VLSYPAAIPLSTRALNHLGGLIRRHRSQRRSRWRRLDPARQALLALAHLRNGETYTAWPAASGSACPPPGGYVREAVDLLAAAADDLATAMAKIHALAYAILDGTLIPTDRIADQKPYCSGKHRRHAVNVQVIADPAERFIWASAALPGAVHDLTAARTHDLINALANANVMTFADKAPRVPVAASGHRSNATDTDRSCPAGRRPSTAPMPGSAPSANGPTPPSRPGKS